MCWDGDVVYWCRGCGYDVEYPAWGEGGDDDEVGCYVGDVSTNFVILNFLWVSSPCFASSFLDFCCLFVWIFLDCLYSVLEFWFGRFLSGFVWGARKEICTQRADQMGWDGMGWEGKEFQHTGSKGSTLTGGVGCD